MIDIILCCYNQEETIRQSVESIFSQEFPKNEPVNLVIADDCSQDSTTQIIKNIIPPKQISITYLDSQQNLGLVKNYERAFKVCNGDFVFILEGDDWWHHPNHIRQHIEFLREHSDISMTWNRITFYECIGGKYTSHWDSENKKYKTYTISEQILANRIGNLSACCFRGKYIRTLPKKLFDIGFADWLLGMIMAEKGNIAILQESTSTYRVTPNGQWSGMTAKEQRDACIKAAEEYDSFFDEKYHSDFELLKKRLQKENYSWINRITPKNIIKYILPYGVVKLIQKRGE